MIKLIIGRTGRFFLVFAGLVLLFIGCNSQDMEFLQPYQLIYKDFEDVPQMSPLEEEKPPIVEPEKAEVIEPEISENFFPDLSEAESAEDIDSESLEILARVFDFVEGQDQDNKTK